MRPFIVVNIDNTLAGLNPLISDAIPSSLSDEFYMANLPGLMAIKPYSQAVETMNWLNQYVELVYTTGRPLAANFLTLRWLQINGFPAGHLYLARHDQRYIRDACAIIDDDPEVLAFYPPEDCTNRVYIKAHHYNQGSPGIRFRQWSQFANILRTQAAQLNRSPKIMKKPLGLPRRRE